jgi:hypothetical protein
MRTMDNRVLVTPPTEKGVIISTTQGGIKFVGNYDTLVKTEAVADGPDGIKAGDAIFISGTSVKQPWAKVVYDVGHGKTGVLVPREAVILVEPKA